MPCSSRTANPHAQESLGFPPFEMLYGRSVDGPLQILRQLWTKEQAKQRFVPVHRRSQTELRRNQTRQKRQLDYRAKERAFAPADQVLVLLPTSDNKLLMQLKGPFDVLERVEGHDYRIQLFNRQKVLHANLLKQYIPAVTEEAKLGISRNVRR